MDQELLCWPEDTAPNGIKTWVSEFFAAADTEGSESAERFAEFFQDDATLHGLADSLLGKQAIYESRLKAWDTVESRKHILFKAYTFKKDFSDILLLGKLESTMKNGNSFELEFAAQVLFGNPQSNQPKAYSYRVWADRQIAFNAAKGN